MRKQYSLVLVLFFIILSQAYSLTIVRFPAGETITDTRYDYPAALLDLALDKTLSTDGPYRIIRTHPGSVQERMMRLLSLGQDFDVITLPASTHADELLRPIPVPIRKGMLGWRLLLIHKDSQSDFQAVRFLFDLQKFRAGYGSNWGDLPVLEHNFAHVITNAQYDPLFTMLQAKRFDFLHRAIHEPWNELAIRKNSHPDLMIEPILMLYYHNAEFFYVNKENIALADRIHRGLLQALDDGSFDSLLYQWYGEYLAKIDFQNRRIFNLNNPFIPDSLPLDEPKFWFNPFLTHMGD